MADEENPDEMIPKSVMLKRINAKNAHIEKMEFAQKELADKLASASAWESEAAAAGELRAQLESRNQEFETYRHNTSTRESLFQSGILDPADQELVLWKYNRLEGEKPDLKVWLAEDAKADPHLSSTIFKSTTPPEAAQVPRPSPNNGAGQPPAAGQPLTWDVIATWPAEERIRRNSEIKAILGYK